MTFESRHDAEALGPLFAQDVKLPDASCDLVSLADLVENWAAQQRRPKAVAAEAVVAVLSGVVHPLFMTQPRRWALRIEDEFEWEARRQARAAGMVTTVRRPSKLAAAVRSDSASWSATDWGQGGSLARLGVSSTQLRKARVVADDGSPGRYGRAGALELLRLWLGDDHDSPAGQRAKNLHGDKLQRLAMLKADAMGSFPELFELAELPVRGGQQTVLPALLDVQPLRPTEPETDLRARVGDRRDDVPDAEALAAELRRLKADGVRGPIQRLAEKYGCSRDTIERRIGPVSREGGGHWLAPLTGTGGKR